MFELEQVSDNVWAHTKGETRCNVASIKLKNTGIMVDSGLDPISAKNARKAAEKAMGVPIKYLVLTHYHSDHVCGNQVFKDCEIIATVETQKMMKEDFSTNWTEEKLAQFISENPEFEEKWQNLELTLPTKTFVSEYIIEEDDDKVEIIETHGHCKGSCYVYVPKEEVIIAGDLLFSEMFPYGGDPTVDPYLWIDAYTQMIYLTPRKVVPGHGPITYKEELEIQQKYLELLVKKIEDLVVDGTTKEELFERSDLPKFPYEVDLNRRNLLLDKCYDAIKEAVNSF